MSVVPGGASRPEASNRKQNVGQTVVIPTIWSRRRALHRKRQRKCEERPAPLPPGARPCLIPLATLT
jgi:hypothetical protein